MIKTILVPIHIAQKEAGLGALSLARDLAKLRGSKLILFMCLRKHRDTLCHKYPQDFMKRL